MASRFAQTFAALSEPEYRKLYLGQAISVAGIMFTVVALPFAVLSIGGSATDIGLVEAANLVPLLLVLLVGGVWADRLPRQKVMLVADLGRAALQLTTAALLVTAWPACGTGRSAGASWAPARRSSGPPTTGLVPQTVTPARLQQANALAACSRALGGRRLGASPVCWSPPSAPAGRSASTGSPMSSAAGFSGGCGRGRPYGSRGRSERAAELLGRLPQRREAGVSSPAIRGSGRWSSACRPSCSSTTDRSTCSVP